MKEVANKEVGKETQYDAQFPATIVSNRYNFMNMHENFLNFLSIKLVYLPLKFSKVGFLPRVLKKL